MQSVFKEAYLYSTWCSDVAYILDPDIAFEDVPVLNDASEIQMDVVYDEPNEETIEAIREAKSGKNLERLNLDKLDDLVAAL